MLGLEVGVHRRLLLLHVVDAGRRLEERPHARPDEPQNSEEVEDRLPPVVLHQRPAYQQPQRGPHVQPPKDGLLTARARSVSGIFPAMMLVTLEGARPSPSPTNSRVIHKARMPRLAAGGATSVPRDHSTTPASSTRVPPYGAEVPCRRLREGVAPEERRADETPLLGSPPKLVGHGDHRHRHIDLVHIAQNKR